VLLFCLFVKHIKSRVSPSFSPLPHVFSLGRMIQMLNASDPHLVQLINQNREQFLRLMAEPSDMEMHDDEDDEEMGDDMGDQLGSLIQSFQNAPPAQRAQMAQAMGIPVDQLPAIMQVNCRITSHTPFVLDPLTMRFPFVDDAINASRGSSATRRSYGWRWRRRRRRGPVSAGRQCRAVND